MRERLSKDATPLGKAREHYYRINNGPWSDLDDHAAFLPGVPAKKPAGANFYPEDMTKPEFEAWVKTLPKPQQGRGHWILHRNPSQRQQIADDGSRTVRPTPRN